MTEREIVEMVKENDSVKQLFPDGTNILNTIDTSKSEFEKGKVAIEITINNSKKTEVVYVVDNGSANTIKTELIDVIKKYLTDDIVYFDEEIITSSSINFMIGEIVREKLLNVTAEEVPHSLTCHCIKYEEKKNIVNIMVDIVVDRDSIKKSVIGKNGTRLKEIGSLAREEIEELVGKKVYLELFVKTIKNWKDKEKYLSDLGFMDFKL